MFEEIQRQARQAVLELLEAAGLKPGDLLVIGCSSSEVVGERIGKGSSMEAAQAVFAGVYPVLKERGIFLAAQCCEHLNRALILEQAAAEKFGYGPRRRLLCHYSMGESGGALRRGARPGQGRDGHRRHPHRHASERGGGAGVADGEEDRPGQSGLRPDPAPLYRRRAGQVSGGAEMRRSISPDSCGNRGKLF